jgi:hypothetical protein
MLKCPVSITFPRLSESENGGEARGRKGEVEPCFGIFLYDIILIQYFLS